MKIDNNLINEIRGSVDIVEVISSYLPLKSQGKNYFGICPFHDDKSPSMSVSREKQIYTCFACGATGNVFKFIQDYENISFLESVKKCADMSGISIDIGQATNRTNKNSELYEIFELSQKFYVNNINSKLGTRALDYLNSRGLDNETIKQFQIGLSMNENTKLTELLKKKGYSDKFLTTSGLVNESNLTMHDVYRNRIMFPIHDIYGKVVGYNGRVYNGEKENKYINPKETPLFKKREILYNYYQAKDECRIKKSVIIMEGPMDVIRAYTVGIKNVVATLGTAITKEHAMLIRKLASQVILCFDGDDAGLKATKSAIVELDKVGIIPFIVRLEDNFDPDEYILKRGKEAFLNKINNPLNVVDFKQLELRKNLDFSNPEQIATYVNSMIDNISNLDDEVLVELTLNKLSQETNLDKGLLKSKIKKEEIKPSVDISRNTSKRLTKYEKSERNLIYYMLYSKEIIKIYENKISSMPTKEYRKLAIQIVDFYKKNGYINVADLLTSIQDDVESIAIIGQLSELNLKENYSLEEINDYIDNILEYNEKNIKNEYKKQMKTEADFYTKLELANKALAYKIRREEND